jgi:hypothetical protein
VEHPLWVNVEMSRYLEIPVHGPLEQIARRAHLAFQTVGRIKSYEPTSGISGIIRCDGGSAQVQVRWHAKDNHFLLDIAADSPERLYQVADRALYIFASEYKDVTISEQEEVKVVPQRWYERFVRVIKR